MAEYVDFHYMPLEGKITGKQVLKQTEDAINDLGQHVYEIDIDNEKIQEAIDTSNQAIETAEEALAVVTTNRAVWYNSVTELREAIIDNGIVAAIKGYAFAGDEGQAFYVVREKKSGDVDDGKTIIFLDAGNVAEIIANTGITNMFDFDEDGYLSQIVDGDISNQYGEKKRLASYEGQQEIVEAFNDVINASLDIKGNAESARNSAEIASNTMTQLLNYLATKEEITAPIVDPTLTISGAAADAKVTGDKISDIDNALLSLYIPSPAWTIYASGVRAHKELGTGINAIIGIDPVVNGAIGVVGFADDTYSGTRQYESGWLTGDVSLSNLNPTYYYQVLFQTNPQTTLNQTTVDSVIVKYSCGLTKIEEGVDDVDDKIDALDSALRQAYTLTSDLVAGGYITTNVAIGTVVDFTPTTGNYKYIIYPCKAGDKYTLYGRGGNAPRLWAVTDAEQKLVSVSASSLDVASTSPVTVEITIPNGYFIMNCNSNIAYGLTLSRLDAVGVEDVENIIAESNGKTFTEMSKVDRFLMSTDIHNIFTTDVSNLPAHPWDAGNGYYSSITVSEMYALWDDLVTAHSDELTMTELGTCSDGVNQLRAYKFTPKTLPFKYKPFRPKIMVTCATHGWEKCGTETLLMLLKMMFDSWYLDPVLETLRWDVDWVIVPIVNPYGFDNNIRKNANNVDINRNYAQGWALRTQDTESSIYQGLSALDQPESTIVNNLMITEQPDIGIDFHDFGGNETRLDWAEFEPNRILSAHIAQLGLDRINRHLVRQFSFMSGVDPTATGQASETQIVGKTINAFYGNNTKIAYTFESCGELTYEPSKKRFNDNHALACIEMFSNFVAEILTEMYRSGFTKSAIVVEE